MNDQTLCMCQQLLARIQGGCNNCGQQHLGAIPCPVQPGSCCPAKPCMLCCCCYKDQNIFAFLDELPTKDFSGNMDPAHILTNLNGSGIIKSYGSNYSVSTQPYSRSYSLASSHQGRRTTIASSNTAPDMQNNHSETASVKTPAAMDQRTYMLCNNSTQIQQCGGRSFFDNHSSTSRVHVDQINSSSHHSTTSLDEESDSSLYGRLGANLANCSTVSTMGGCPISRCSLPWIHSTSCSCFSPTTIQQEQLQSVVGQPSVVGQRHNNAGQTSCEERDDILIDESVRQHDNRKLKVSIAEQDKFHGSDTFSKTRHANTSRSRENKMTGSFIESMGGCSKNSIGYEQLLQQQAGELAQMRSSQEMDLRILETKEPTPKLRDQIEYLMETQQTEQLQLQDFHRQQQHDHESLICRSIGPLLPIKQQKHVWQTNQPGDYHGINNGSSLMKQIYSDGNSSGLDKIHFSMQHGDGASRGQTSTEDMNQTNNSVISLRRNSKENHSANRRNVSCQFCSEAYCSCSEATVYEDDIVGGNLNFDEGPSFCRASSYPSPTKSEPTVQSDRECTRPNASNRRMDILSVDRIDMLRKEFGDGEKSRQMIADAMAKLTIKYRDEVVARVVQQNKEDARKADEQRQRDAEAAEASAALQREKDTIESAMRRIAFAREAAEERKQLELLAIEDLKRQGEQLTELKKKEINLTEAAIKRQLAAEKAVSVLRQMKEDTVERNKLSKEQAEYTSRLEEMRIGESVQRRKAAEDTIADVIKIRKHEESKIVKRTKEMAEAAQRQHTEDEALAATEARRRKELAEDADADRQAEIKRAAWSRELRAIQAENLLKDAEEEAILATKKFQEEDDLLEQKHKAALLAAANRRKQEEQEFQEQKRLLIEEYAKERAKRRQTIQQEQQQRQSTPTIQSPPKEPQRKLTTTSRRIQLPPPQEPQRKLTTRTASSVSATHAVPQTSKDHPSDSKTSLKLKPCVCCKPPSNSRGYSGNAKGRRSTLKTQKDNPSAHEIKRMESQGGSNMRLQPSISKENQRKTDASAKEAQSNLSQNK